MFSAIVGDIIGSIHEKIPAHLNKRKASPTDDSFLTCACAQWVNSIDLNDIEDLKNKLIQEKLKNSAIFFLKKWWSKYPTEGFSKGFSQWASNKDFIQGHRHTNGSLMRQSPIAQFCVKEKISIENCILLAEIFASPTHDHADTYPAVRSHIKNIFNSLTRQIHPHDLKYLQENTPYKIMPLDYWKNIGSFVWDAPQSLAIAYSALYHAQSFQETIDNCIYIGGDVDTYCSIACPIAVGSWTISEHLEREVDKILLDYPDISILIK